MAARAVAVVRDNPRFAEVLVEERKSGLVFYKLVQPSERPDWDQYYALWARIVPTDPQRSAFRLEYMRYTGKWQPLPFPETTLEDCVREIERDSFALFFS
ncbi:MAG: hypothetical protein ACR2M0_07040 [Chloroflexia bacterium]